MCLPKARETPRHRSIKDPRVKKHAPDRSCLPPANKFLGRLLTLPQGIGTIGLVLIGLLLAGFVFRYGPLSPCGALKQEVRAQLLQNAMRQASGNKWEQAGIGIGMALAGPMLDTMIGGLTPAQCTKGSLQLLLRGKIFLLIGGSRCLPQASRNRFDRACKTAISQARAG